VGAAIVDGRDLYIHVIPASVGLFVLDAYVGEVDLLVEVRFRSEADRTEWLSCWDVHVPRRTPRLLIEIADHRT
jgi:hypothetical protein